NLSVHASGVSSVYHPGGPFSDGALSPRGRKSPPTSTFLNRIPVQTGARGADIAGGGGAGEASADAPGLKGAPALAGRSGRRRGRGSRRRRRGRGRRGRGRGRGGRPARPTGLGSR